MHNDKGQFVKGQTPWNKGKYGYMGANRTSFTKEAIESRRVIGKPRIGKDQLVCASNEKVPVKSYNGKVYMHCRRMSYAKYIVEKELGIKLDRNEVVYHIDGDIFNNDLSNLEVITRKELLKRNRNK